MLEILDNSTKMRICWIDARSSEMYCGCLKRKGRPSSLKRIVVVIADFRSLVDRHVKSTPNYIYKNNVSKKKRNK